MASGESRDRLTTLFYIPSFYGALTWGIWLFLYVLRLIRLDPCSGEAYAIFLGTELFFLLSLALSYPLYRRSLVENGLGKGNIASRDGAGGLKLMIVAFHAVGFAGLLSWGRSLAGYMGGFDVVLFALLQEAARIRGDTGLPANLGIQLSFLGWIAVALTVFGVARKELSKWWLVPALLQFAGNFLYIGRMQPVWIIFTSLLMLVAAVKVEIRKVLRWTGLVFLLFVALFWLVGNWTGKTYYEGKFDDPLIPGMSQVMYAYGVSGFAYFNHMLANHEPIAYEPDRVIHPAKKVLSRFGLAEEPPDLILDFYDVPFETNVGTFLEPFYRDGGLLFVLFGVLAYSFGLDLLGLKLLRSGTPLAVFAWADLCFTAFIAFFTPQLIQSPVWLFTILGLLSIGLRYLHRNIIPFRVVIEGEVSGKGGDGGGDPVGETRVGAEGSLP